jgi:hypothetical protein
MEGEAVPADVLALINTEALNAARILGIQVRYNPDTQLLHPNPISLSLNNDI